MEEMKTLVDQLREMVEKSCEDDEYPTDFAEPFIGRKVERPEEERELFTAIADRIEREYMPLPRGKLTRHEQERTCHFRNDGHGILWCDAQGCDYEMDDYLPIPNYCPNCGAKVVE